MTHTPENPPTVDEADCALDTDGVSELTTLAIPTINRGIAKGTFIKPHKFGRKNIWMKSDVLAWLRSLPLTDDAAANPLP